MKKIIAIILVVLCAFSLVACGDKDNSTNVLKKLSPTGKKVEKTQAVSFIEDRDNAYVESDMEKFENLSEQWLEINVKYVDKSERQSGETIRRRKNITEIIGVIGATSDGELIMDLEVVHEIESVEIENGSKVYENESKEKAHVIVYRGMAYMDIKGTFNVNGEKSTEETKSMVPLHRLAFGNIDQINPEELYGTGVYKILGEIIDIKSQEKVDYYLSSDKIFIETDMDEEGNGDESNGVVQFEVEYVEQSGFVNTVRCYGDVEHRSESATYSSKTEIKLGLYIAQCEAQTITVPDASDYE